MNPKQLLPHSSGMIMVSAKVSQPMLKWHPNSYWRKEFKVYIPASILQEGQKYLFETGKNKVKHKKASVVTLEDSQVNLLFSFRVG